MAKGEAELAAAAKVTRDDVMQGLQEAIDLARLKSDPAAMIAGWRGVGKMCGFYAPERKVVQFSADAWAQQEALTHIADAELADRIVAGAEQAA
ncbi:MAG: hypothetical protein ABI537_10630 [Casimicrobiaceae bacterium]